MASVILAEDDIDHQRALTELLHRLGHEVTVVADGEAGLAAVAKHRPDLVVADVDMPRMDGLQMCRAIRDDPALADVPVLIVTAYLTPGDPRLMSAGASGVVRKPFTMRELSDAVQAHVAATEAGGDPPGGAFAEALLQTLDTGVAACDSAGRLVLFNGTLRRFFGGEGQAVPLHEWPQRFTLRHHDGTPLAVEDMPLLRALAGECVERAGLLADDRQGTPRWFTVNACPVRDADGVLRGAVAAVHDVTAEYRARRYQDCTAEVLRVLAGSPDTAAAGEQILRAIATTLGWPYMRLWGVDPVADRLRPVATYTAPGEQALPTPDGVSRGDGLSGQCWERGELLWVPDIHGDDSPVLPEVAAGSPYRTAGGVPVRSGTTVTGVMTFFSHGRQEPEPALATLLTGIAGNIGAYLEQRRGDELALQLAASTQDYIALVGHELRTPLTSIAAYAELITDSPDATTLGEVRDLLDAITRNNTRLRGLVDELLDLSAVESGHADFTVTTVDLAALAAEAIADAEPRCRERGITIHTETSEAVPVAADAVRLRQVVDHLLSNAVAYGPEDSTVTLSVSSDDETAVLAVTDQGGGIPDDERPRLFRRLYRGGNARHAGIPGSGLGLALTRAILDRHHGTITLTPADPAGTVATVRLPRTRTRAGTPGRAAPAAGDPGR
jgi:PAS domain S-box-containing protein